MGFIQRYKDAKFIGECAMVMKRAAPETNHTAEFFCEDNTELLLSFREKHGAPPAAAIPLACIHLLNKSQALIDSGISYGEYQALIDASIYARATVERNNALAPSLTEPLLAFALALKSEKGKTLLGNRG